MHMRCITESKDVSKNIQKVKLKDTEQGTKSYLMKKLGGKVYNLWQKIKKNRLN